MFVPLAAVVVAAAAVHGTRTGERSGLVTVAAN